LREKKCVQTVILALWGVVDRLSVEAWWVRDFNSRRTIRPELGKVNKVTDCLTGRFPFGN